MLKLGKVPASVYYQYALLCMKTNDKETAETIFKKVIQLDPKNPYAHKDLGVVYLSQRLFDYAKDEFETAYKLAPQDSSVIFEYANFNHAMNDFVKAQELYEKAYAINSDSVDICIFRALNYLRLNNIEKALELFLEANKKFPSQHTILFNIGLIYFQKKSYDAAKEFLSDAYSLYQDAETMNALALTFYEIKEYENAKNLAQKLLVEYPDNINILLLLAKSYIELEDVENTIKYLEKILKIFPEQPEAKELYERIKGIN